MAINDQRVDKNTSQMLNLLRLPLAFLIVAGHANTLKFPLNSDGQLITYDYDVIKYPIHLFSEVLFGPAVPLFFMISGFLFFAGINHFDWPTYKQKMKRRAKTLLVPYLVWNVVYLLPSFISTIIGKHDYDVWYFIESLWIMPSQHDRILEMAMATPADPPLWFIRDLMVCMVFSPVIWLVTKRKWLCAVILSILALYWFLCLPCQYLFPGLSIPSFLFFSLGATTAIWKVDIAKLLNDIKRSRLLIMTYAILSIIELIMVDYSFSIEDESVNVIIHQNPYLHVALVFVGCFAFISVSYAAAKLINVNGGGRSLYLQAIGYCSITQG